MRHHEQIRFHLAIRVDRLEGRLGRLPSFLPVGRQEIRDFAQWQLDNKLTYGDHTHHQEVVISSFTGILPPLTVWNVEGVNLKQI